MIAGIRSFEAALHRAMKRDPLARVPRRGRSTLTRLALGTREIVPACARGIRTYPRRERFAFVCVGEHSDGIADLYHEAFGEMSDGVALRR